MSWTLYGRPADGTGTTDETQPGRPEEATPEAVARLEAEVAALKNEKAELQDRFLRKAAEFDNFRKRMEREKSETGAFAKSSVLLELLPIVDACERALESFSGAEESENLSRYRAGVELLYKQLGDALTRIGVTPIEALGQEFDPNLHEALSREETTEHEENTVLQVLRRGYLFKDRLLRPAQVKVAVRPRP
jgi:molecular chaperone GrpE